MPEDNQEEQQEMKKEEKLKQKFEDSDLYTKEIDDKHPELSHLKKWDYPHFLNRVANRVNAGYSPIIVICGEERVGKSELAQLILHYLHNKMNVLKGEINRETIKEHLAYTVEEFMDLIIEKHRTGVIVDEAGSLLKATKHNTKYNEVADEVIQTMAYKNNVYIFITPQFTRLDKKVRTKADCVLNVKKRGQVMVTAVNTNFGKIRANEKDLRKLPIPAFTPRNRPPKEIRLGYDEKEKDFKDTNLKEKRQEIAEENQEDVSIDVL